MYIDRQFLNDPDWMGIALMECYLSMGSTKYASSVEAWITDSSPQAGYPIDESGSITINDCSEQINLELNLHDYGSKNCGNKAYTNSINKVNRMISMLENLKTVMEQERESILQAYRRRIEFLDSQNIEHNLTLTQD